jgi:hypothetical protein
MMLALATKRFRGDSRGGLDSVPTHTLVVEDALFDREQGPLLTAQRVSDSRSDSAIQRVPADSIAPIR